LGLDGNVAIYTHGEVRTEANRQADDAAIIRRHAMSLHAGVNQNLRRKSRNEVGQMKGRHGDPARFRQNRSDLHGCLGALAFDPFDHCPVAEQGVVEGHRATNDRREGIVAQND
jgi:hypothetical protein